MERLTASLRVRLTSVVLVIHAILVPLLYWGVASIVQDGYTDLFVNPVRSYSKLVADVKAQAPDAKADNVQQSVTMAKPGKMYSGANVHAKVVRDLDPGMTLYPSGDKDGIWWKVTDELGNEGWVPSTLFQLAK